MVEIISVVLGIIGGAISLTGILVRFTLVPYLEHRLLSKFTILLNELLETKAEIIAVARMFDGHLEWSQDEVDRIWVEIRSRKRRD